MRELGERGRATELELQARPRLLQPCERVARVHREPDRAARVRDAAGDRLADPPRGVRGELEALAPVELLDRVHQAEVALLDQVQQREARGLVLLGDRDDEAQVRLHEGALGIVAVPDVLAELTLLGRGQGLAAGFQLGAGFVAALDLLGEADLVVLGEQRVLPDIGQIEPNQIFFVALNTFLRQENPSPKLDTVDKRQRAGRLGNVPSPAPQ